MILFDRTYVKDKKGYIFKIVGDIHPTEQVDCYVKYYPDENGDRTINKLRYFRNTYVFNSFKLREDLINFSERMGTVATSLNKMDITEVYDPKVVLKQILTSPKQKKTLARKQIHVTFKHIFDETDLTIDDFGITGSLLVNLDNGGSDLDLLVYGSNATQKLKAYFAKTDFYESYIKEPLTTVLYERRKAHIPAITKEVVLKQESRKIQGQLNGMHFNFQPVRNTEEVHDSILYQSKLYYISKIEVIAKIIDDKEGFAAPAVYKIKIQNILDIEAPIKSLLDNISYYVSYIGVYSGCFNKGDTIYIKGKLCLMNMQCSRCYAIVNDPWSLKMDSMSKILL